MLKQFIHYFFPVITKNNFRFNQVINGLDLSKMITQQPQVILNYQDQEGIKTVPAKHGVITIFLIDGMYFLLAKPMQNPEADTFELQASIGGKEEAEQSVSMYESLNNEIKANTNNKLEMAEFEISSTYVCHRVPDWGEWSVCFLKLAALSKSYSMPALKNLVSSIDSDYGIYELDQVIVAAKLTAGMQESADKPKSNLKNYHTGLQESWVIFDDNAISKLFETTCVQKLFNHRTLVAKL